MAQPVKNILIVGGGTAGWMAATYLATQLKATGGRVTVVESPAIPTIGVGEATVPPLVGFFRILGISEDEFMRRSHATYKFGVKFVNWREGNDTYWHPFGPVGGSIDAAAWRILETASPSDTPGFRLKEIATAGS